MTNTWELCNQIIANNYGVVLKACKQNFFKIHFLSLHPGCKPHHIGGTHRQNLDWYVIWWY